MSKCLGVRSSFVLGITALSLIVGGCPPNTTTQVPIAGGDVTLKHFASAAELLQYFRDQALATRSSNGGLEYLVGATPTVMSDATSGSNSSDGTVDTATFSTTNLQEVGVDESDTLKSDGTNFYIAKGKSLRIIQATPRDGMSEISRVEFDDELDSLYLVGQRVIVLGRKYSTSSGGVEIMIWPPYYANAAVRVTTVDVSNPAQPTKVAENVLDGALVSSRLTDGKLILVLTIVPPLPANPTVFSVNALTLDSVLPKMQTSAGRSDLIVPENWYRPDSPDGYRTTAVVTLDASNVESVLGSVAVVADAQTVYASTEAVYAVSNHYVYDPNNGYGNRTTIHKFAFNTQGIAEYVASGELPGTLLNQFSLGEYNGLLRVATNVSILGALITPTPIGSTVSSATAQAGVSPPQAYNAVYVLGQNGASLDVTGKVENIAPGETLHSARFLGNHGFLVTFHKVDPLFILDLTDPANPVVAGELKIPGFSDYLHPVDETHLIGVGKYTLPTNQGFDWFQGIQISLFDVSDWSHPQAIQQITLGGRGSEAEVERTHKAFTYLPDSGLLALPVQVYSVEQSPYQLGQLEFDGVVAYHVDLAMGFTELGRLPSVTNEPLAGYYRVYTPWRRAATIGNVLYAVTPEGVRAADLASLDATNSVTLTPEPDEIIPVDSSPGAPGPTLPL